MSQYQRGPAAMPIDKTKGMMPEFYTNNSHMIGHRLVILMCSFLYSKTITFTRGRLRSKVNDLEVWG